MLTGEWSFVGGSSTVDDWNAGVNSKTSLRVDTVVLTKSVSG